MAAAPTMAGLRVSTTATSLKALQTCAPLESAASKVTCQPRRGIRCSAASDGASSSSSQTPPKTSAGDATSSKKASAHKHSRRQLIFGGMATGMMVAVGCPLCDQQMNLGRANASEWGYGDLSGPQEWADICKTGTTQSPIDIPLTDANPVLTTDNSPGAIKFDYKLCSASYLNTGHGTMQVNFPTGTNGCEIGGRKLELLQYHFHAPSEHSFNGVRTAMEAHLVHRDAEGKLAVVGVMLEASPKAKRNLCVEAALAFGPDEKGAQIGAPVQCYDVPVVGDGEEPTVIGTVQECLKIQLSPTPLLPKPDRPDGYHSYVHYKGSLTTPPCSEGVDWFVLTAPLKIPDTQVVEFMRYVGDKQTLALNSRPRQDLGDRRLFIGPTVEAEGGAEVAAA